MYSTYPKSFPLSSYDIMDYSFITQPHLISFMTSQTLALCLLSPTSISFHGVPCLSVYKSTSGGSLFLTQPCTYSSTSSKFPFLCLSISQSQLKTSCHPVCNPQHTTSSPWSTLHHGT